MPDERSRLQHFYDDFADAYAGFADSPLRKEYEWPAVRSLLPDLGGKRVVDVACGPGDSAVRLAERGADVLGVDAREEMVRVADRRFGDEIEFRQADIREPLEFVETGSIDVVLSQLTLGHVEDWQPVFEEFARMTAADGTLVLSLSHPFSDYLMVRDESYPVFGGLFGETGEPAIVTERDRPRYADVERFEGEWETATNDNVTFFRRPLASVFGPLFGAGFSITGLEEPAPTPELEASQPERCENLR
jgi:ubiquinone/menaquinone biosynthesis C-methylase UbiE